MPSFSILVFAHWSGMPAPQRMGVLEVTRSRGREIFAFNYDKAWLAQPGHFALDPALQLFGGPQYPAADKPNFGVFLDTSPDRWGRLLMQRREALVARREKRPVRALTGTDHLLGVYDFARMGALRFKLDPQGPFLSDDHGTAIPPMARLRELEQASLALEDEDTPLKDQVKWLDLLLAPGSSLGGARPKASVIDERGQLWIAKFPSRDDTVDQGAWEFVLHQLAVRCGIHMAPARLMPAAPKAHGRTFLTRRFDRDPKGARIHFTSAMTALGRSDGDDARAGASYLELAEFLMRHGARTDADLLQLWMRIVFNIRVSNTDDHLRNHGFLLAPQHGGWLLAPAYDLNPDPHGLGLSLNIDMHSNALSMPLALEVAPYFRIPPKKAARALRSISQRVGKEWMAIAKTNGLSRAAIDRMAPAFAAHE